MWPKGRPTRKIQSTGGHSPQMATIPQIAKRGTAICQLIIGKTIPTIHKAAAAPTPILVCLSNCEYPSTTTPVPRRLLHAVGRDPESPGKGGGNPLAHPQSNINVNVNCTGSR